MALSCRRSAFHLHVLLACIVGTIGMPLFALHAGKATDVWQGAEDKPAFHSESDSSDADVLELFCVADIAAISPPQICGLCVVEKSDGFQRLIVRVHFKRGPPIR